MSSFDLYLNFDMEFMYCENISFCGYLLLICYSFCFSVDVVCTLLDIC